MFKKVLLISAVGLVAMSAATEGGADVGPDIVAPSNGSESMTTLPSVHTSETQKEKVSADAEKTTAPSNDETSAAPIAEAPADVKNSESDAKSSAGAPQPTPETPTADDQKEGDNKEKDEMQITTSASTEETESSTSENDEESSSWFKKVGILGWSGIAAGGVIVTLATFGLVRHSKNKRMAASSRPRTYRSPV